MSTIIPIPPVVNLPNPNNSTVINFTDYKITNGIVNSDWQTMIFALNAVSQSQASILNIPTGNYVFDDVSILNTTASAHIVLNNLTDLTINGNGSTLVFQYLLNGFQFFNCQRILIENLITVWNFDIAAPGLVESLNGQTVIVVSGSFPLPNGNPVGAVNEYNTTTLQWQMSSQEVYNPSNVTLVAPQTLYSPDFSIFPIGDQVVVRYYTYGCRGFEMSFNNNADITCNTVTIKNCPGMCFVAYGADRGFQFLNCIIERRNPTRDLVSSGADGIHIGMTHGDTIIKNCDFGYMGDDAVNIHSIWETFVSKTNNTTALISTIVWDSYYIQIGDSIQFLNQTTFVPTGSIVNVSSASYNPSSQVYTLNFSQSLSTSLKSGNLVANKSRSSNRCYIYNNYFHDHRARGILIQNQEVSVVNNHIANVMGGAIQVTTDDYQTNEGFGSANAIISNNYCDGCNYGYWGGFNNLSGICAGVINIFTNNNSGNLVNTSVHQSMNVVNNTINNTPNIAFFVGSVKTLNLSNNTIQNCPTSANQGMYLADCSQITISNNQAVSCSYAHGAGIKIGSNTIGITQSNNVGF